MQEMTRRLSQLNIQLHKDAEESRHKEKEIVTLKEKNTSLSDLLSSKSVAYDSICEEVYYLISQLIREFYLFDFSKSKINTT
jgi:cell shape-determining protein MreC